MVSGERKTLIRATGLMGMATLASRIAGMVRDIVVARIFGAGFASDAFFMAFTLPNLLRRFFAEGSLTAAFVPTFSRVVHDQGRDEARRVFHICLTLLTLVMLAVCAMGILGSPLLVRMIGYGFEQVPGKLELTTLLNRVMFPYLLLVSLLALITGVLNVFGHYFVPAFSTVLLNLAMIGSAFWLAPRFDPPILGLAVGVLIGGVLQLLLQLPVLARFRMLSRVMLDLHHPAVRTVGRLMLPGILGVAIYQINILTSRLLASFLVEGSVSWLYYAQRLFEFPQGVFVVSLAQALLPAISRQAAAGAMEEVRASLRYAMALILLITVPATLGLVICAVPVFSLCFLGGAFQPQDMSMTAYALAAYAPGLVFTGVSRVIVPTFYALQDTRTPVQVSVQTLVVNVVACGLLMLQWGHIGLALGVSLASLYNAVALALRLQRQYGMTGLEGLAVPALKMTMAAVVMAGVVWACLHGIDWVVPGARLLRGGVLVGAVMLAVAVYAGCCWLLGVEQLRELGTLLRRKWRRTAPSETMEPPGGGQKR